MKAKVAFIGKKQKQKIEKQNLKWPTKFEYLLLLCFLNVAEF